MLIAVLAAMPAAASKLRSRSLRVLAAGTLLCALGWFGWVYLQIVRVAGEDQARPADAIAVFGAAEYAGRPSPVLHARLDHAVALYERGVAPVVITLGGGGDRDSGQSEGGVGRDYLLAQGIPFDRIVAETNSTDTEQQVDRLAEIADADGLQRLVVVSDGTHLFRIRELCRDAGLEVYTSPRGVVGRISWGEEVRRYAHEMVSYTVFRVRLGVDGLRRRLRA